MKWVVFPFFFVAAQALGQTSFRWPSLPNPMDLRWQGVREELRLTPKQEANLIDIWNQIRRVGGSSNAASVQFSSKERTRQQVEDFSRLLKRNNEQISSLEKASLGLLSPSQRARLKELHYQMSGPLSLAHPEVAKAIGTTQSQTEKYMKVREDYMSRQLAIKDRSKAAVWSKSAMASMKRDIERIFSKVQLAKYEKMKGMLVKDIDRLRTNFYPVQPAPRS